MQAPKHLDTVKLCQNKVENYHIGLVLGYQGKSINSVTDAAHKLKILLVSQNLGHEPPEIIVCICDKYASFGFHKLLSSSKQSKWFSCIF